MCGDEIPNDRLVRSVLQHKELPGSGESGDAKSKDVRLWDSVRSVVGLWTARVRRYFCILWQIWLQTDRFTENFARTKPREGGGRRIMAVRSVPGYLVQDWHVLVLELRQPNVEQYLTISPKPEGYIGQLTVSSSSVSTDGVKLLPNTTYNFTLKAGLKDKWGFPVEPSSWQVQIGPLPPALAIKGGTFQPIYVDGPTRVRVDTANLSSFTFHLRQAKHGRHAQTAQRSALLPAHSHLSRPVDERMAGERACRPGNCHVTNTIYPSIALDANSDRLPSGYYLLYADAPNPYSNDYPLYSGTVLIVGRTGVVAKSDGRNLMLWAADLGSGKPVPNYPLRIEQLKSDGSSTTVATVQTANTGQDGVARLILDKADNVQAVAIFANSNNDALFATTGWNFNINPYDFNGVSAQANSQAYRAGAYVDRPIYRPMQTVYYRGVYRLDDDASYTRAQSGGHGRGARLHLLQQRATVPPPSTQAPPPDRCGHGERAVPGTGRCARGQLHAGFLRARRVAGHLRLAGSATASFQVQEYRKPDFQVDVTASNPVVHGDPVTATINTSYYFGGPLQNVTTTVNIQSSPYYFSWADPKTGETYKFGEYNPIPYDFYSPIPYSTPEPVQSFQARTDANGVLHADVTRYITTTNGSKSVLIEGQVQDLSNQTVAANSTTVVHQGLYYVGLRTDDYIATAKQPTTITVRTVEWTADKTHPNAQVSLTSCAMSGRKTRRPVEAERHTRRPGKRHHRRRRARHLSLHPAIGRRVRHHGRERGRARQHDQDRHRFLRLRQRPRCGICPVALQERPAGGARGRQREVQRRRHRTHPGHLALHTGHGTAHHRARPREALPDHQYPGRLAHHRGASAGR